MSKEAMNITAVDHEYGADQIEILEGLEAVRQVPGMYIGTTSSRGLHHMVYEIVDNSVDKWVSYPQVPVDNLFSNIFLIKLSTGQCDFICSSISSISC